MWVFSLNTYQILHDPRLVESVNVEPWISRGDGTVPGGSSAAQESGPSPRGHQSGVSCITSSSGKRLCGFIDLSLKNCFWFHGMSSFVFFLILSISILSFIFSACFGFILLFQCQVGRLGNWLEIFLNTNIYSYKFSCEHCFWALQY